MSLQHTILVILILILILCILLSIYYTQDNKQTFSDLGALIQLEASRPYGYINLDPANENIYNDVLQSNDFPENQNIQGVKFSKKGVAMIYPKPYPMEYPKDYPIQYPPVVYPMSRPYEN
jgi:hypothetical protein